MNLIYKKERVVSSAFIDSSVKLGIAQAVLLVQDNLTECFDMLGCDGVTYLDLNVFWVFTKMRIRFIERPAWRETVRAESFPVCNAGFRTNVNTAVYRGDKPVLLANQEACVLDKDKHRPVKLTGLPFPKDGFPPAVFEEPFERFAVPEESWTEVFTHVIRSQNIDMSGHMNNNEYIKTALDVFPNDFLLAHEPLELEVHFLGESREGQTLSVCRADLNGALGSYVKIAESGRPVFEMKIVFAE